MTLIFTRREWDGAPRELGDMWRLTKDERTARAFVTTHPRGVELRFEIDGELQLQSQVFGADDDPLFTLAEAWKEKLMSKGWRLP